MRQDIPPPNRTHDLHYIKQREAAYDFFCGIIPALLLMELHWSELMSIFKDALMDEIFGKDDDALH